VWSGGGVGVGWGGVEYVGAGGAWGGGV